MSDKKKAIAKKEAATKPGEALPIDRELAKEQAKELYRANILSVREIGATVGVSHVTILKWAKEGDDGKPWERDLTAKIKAKADQIVARRTLTNGVTSSATTAEELVTEERIVEVNAEVIANVRMRHRSHITRFRVLALNILAEIESQTEHLPLFEELGDLLRSEDKYGRDKLNDYYRAVIAMPGRVDSLKKLAEVLKILIGLEREAFGLTNSEDPEANKNKGPALTAQDAYNRMLNVRS